MDSVESALAAEQGGAERFELCGNLIIGGTSPSPALFRAVRRETKAKIHVLLRPRFGDFLYTDREFGILQEEAESFLEWGADGIVCGLSDATGGSRGKRMQAARGAGAWCGSLLYPAQGLRCVPRPHGDAFLLRSPGSGSDPDVGAEKYLPEGIPLLRELLTAAKRIGKS